MVLKSNRQLLGSLAEYLARIESSTHFRRLTTLAELANAAVFLASDQASAMTGTVANLSGGTPLVPSMRIATDADALAVARRAKPARRHTRARR